MDIDQKCCRLLFEIAALPHVFQITNTVIDLFLHCNGCTGTIIDFVQKGTGEHSLGVEKGIETKMKIIQLKDRQKKGT